MDDASPPPSSPVETATSVVRLQGLFKSYGDVEALRGLDMEIPPGPVGLLGPNGAGKTTLIGVLLGLVEPTRGEARVAGLSPATLAGRLAIRQRVGYMPESDCLLPLMSGVEIVSMLGRLTGLSKNDAMTRAHEVLDYVELDEARYRPLDGYSTGMKQRLKLAQALVHDPELLLLDEPTNGLDPRGRREMLALIDDLGRVQGKNILLCSHLLPDVERTCDHVVMIVRGRAELQASIAELTAAETRALRVDGGERSAELAEVLRGRGMAVTPSEGAFEVEVPSPDGEPDADEVCAAAAEAGIPLMGIEPLRSSLDEVFHRVVADAEASA